MVCKTNSDTTHGGGEHYPMQSHFGMHWSLVGQHTGRKRHVYTITHNSRVRLEWLLSHFQLFVFDVPKTPSELYYDVLGLLGIPLYCRRAWERSVLISEVSSFQGLSTNRVFGIAKCASFMEVSYFRVFWTRGSTVVILVHVYSMHEVTVTSTTNISDNTN